MKQKLNLEALAPLLAKSQNLSVSDAAQHDWEMGCYALYKAHDLSVAKKYFHKAADTYGHAPSMAELGRIYANAGSHVTAEKYLHCAADQHNEPLGIYYLASYYSACDKYQDAIPYFEKLVQEHSAPDAFVSLSNCYYLSGQKDRAKECLLKAAHEHNLAQAFLCLAILENENNNQTQRLEYLHKAADELNDSQAILQLGEIYLNQEKDALKAKEYFQKITEEKHLGYANLNLGTIALINKEYKEAKDLYSKALLYKEFPLALCNLGYIYTLENNVALAKKYLFAASRYGIKEAYANLANLYQNLGYHTKASRYYIQYLELDKAQAYEDQSPQDDFLQEITPVTAQEQELTTSI